jgi:spermidine synthase
MGAPSADLAERGRQRPFLPLLVLFFVSGATGLLYEVLWMRRLTLVFGATQLAVSTVLAAFMAGLAIGALAGGRIADRRSDLLRIYGFLEVGIGVYALLFPFLVAAATGLYRGMVDPADVHFWSSQLAHLVLMGALLVIPTAAMGATLPLLVRFAAGRLSRVGRRTGLLYGFNTVGAVVGTWCTGFLLLPQLGVRTTELAAAGANVLVGLVALAWGMRDQAAGVPEVIDDSEDRAEEASLLEIAPDPDLVGARRGRMVWVVLLVLSVSGACSMIYEVAWSRFLALILGSSVYAFTLMLVAFLVGTAGGALVGSGIVGKRGVRPMRWLAGALAAAGVSAWGTNQLFQFMPYWYVDLYRALGEADELLFGAQGLLACLVMTPTTFCIGLAFPFGIAVIADRADAVGRDVSRLYVFNTVGAVVGSLAAGFVLLPRLGIQETLLVAVVLDLVLAAAVLLALAGRGLARLVPVAATGGLLAAAVLVRPPWDPLLMSAGMYKYVSDLSDFSHEAVRNYAVSDFELLYYAEGTTSVVTVARSVGSGNIWLANNGKVDASSQEDLRTQVLLAHLPMAASPDAKKVLVVGLASGITAGSVTLHPELEQIDILEIEPAVIVASHYFDQHNQQPLKDPRVRMIANDARNHLVLYDGTYDVIINEPSNPWITGVSNLFTREYLELGRSRLTPDGVFCQWLQIYGMGAEDMRSLVRTFAEVFPNVLMYRAVDDSDVLLVGGRANLRMQVSDMPGWFDGPIGADLARIDVREPYDILSYQQADREDLLEVAGDVGLNTDDNVRIEFSAPLFLHYATSEHNSELLTAASSGPWELNRDVIPAGGEVSFLTGMAGAFERRGMYGDAADYFHLAVERAPEDAELVEQLERVTRKLEEE